MFTETYIVLTFFIYISVYSQQFLVKFIFCLYIILHTEVRRYGDKTKEKNFRQGSKGADFLRPKCELN